MKISATQLAAWFIGNPSIKPELFADLVSSLVKASLPNPDRRHFQTGATTGRPGFDGYLEARDAFKPFIPVGNSYWELGTDEDAQDKAEKEYVKRTPQVPADQRREAAFIFVTPVNWSFSIKENGLKKWLDEKKQLGEWHDVRVIDAQLILDWLEFLPAIKKWFYSEIGYSIQGISTVSERWGQLAKVGAPPPLPTQIFLAGKEKACEQLLALLNSTNNRLKISSRYTLIAGDFVAAYCIQQKLAVEIASRILFLKTPEALDNILSQQLASRHILVLDFEVPNFESHEARLITDANEKGHGLVFSGSRGAHQPSALRFPAAGLNQVEDILKGAGYLPERARALATRSEGDIMTLLNILRDLSVFPEWSRKDTAIEMAWASLIGRWGEADFDRELIEGILGKPYGEWVGKIRHLSDVYGAPLVNIGDNWRVSPRYEAWLQAAKYLSKDDLEKFAQAATLVLQEIDPKWELPAKDQIAALIYGKKLRYSPQLRLGIAEALALLGSYGSSLEACPPYTGQQLADKTVSEILASVEPHFWASIDQLLPYLAEASPRGFIEAIKIALRTNPSPFQQLFDTQQDNGFSVSHHMTGLLWALETVAWNPEFLVEVVSLLGKLAFIDPGGRLANRPSRSLTTIFLPWLPQTIANTETKLRAMKKLLATHPKVGFDLLKALLPRAHQTSSGSRRPIWREWIPEDWPERPPRKQYYEEAVEYANLYIEEAFKDKPVLPALIKELENFPHPTFQIAVDKFLSLPVRDDPETQAIWQAVFELVLRNSKYQNAQWSLKGENLASIRKIEERLRPVDPIKRHYNIFSLGEFDYYDRDEDYDVARKRIQKEKTEAINEIIEKKGVEGLLSFAQLVKNPYEVGRIAGALKNSIIENAILPKLLLTSDQSFIQFVAGYIPSSLAVNDWTWVDNIKYQKWSQDEILQFYLRLPFRPDTWNRFEKRLPERIGDYWRNIEANFYATPNGLNEAAEKFLTYGRPSQALDCLFVALQNDKSLNTAKTVEALKMLLKDSHASSRMDPHEISLIFKALQEDKELETTVLIQLEWAYLGYLGRYSTAKPVTLEQAISNDPQSFCLIIRLIYRSSMDETTDTEVSESQKAQATNAWHLLNEWSGFPGFTETGFDSERMKTWVSETVAKCTESGHLKPALIHIAHAAARLENRGQMQTAILELLDEDSENGETMRSSFRSELFTLRGVYTDTEGKEELEIAEANDKRAEEVAKMGFENLARTFREIRDQYKRDAERAAQEEW